MSIDREDGYPALSADERDGADSADVLTRPARAPRRRASRGERTSVAAPSEAEDDTQAMDADGEAEKRAMLDREPAEGADDAQRRSGSRRALLPPPRPALDGRALVRIALPLLGVASIFAVAILVGARGGRLVNRLLDLRRSLPALRR